MSAKYKIHPSENAFLTNPVASANDTTGYGIKIPLSNEEAEDLSEMFKNIPATKTKMSRALTQEEKIKSSTSKP